MAIKINLFYNFTNDYIIGFNNFYDTKTYEYAKHDLCFMIRSLNYKWKQPVAYFFINNSWQLYRNCSTKYSILLLFLDFKAFHSILKCLLVTTNQGLIFYSFANKMHVSIERPYFFANDDKIYYVFDALIYFC